MSGDWKPGDVAVIATGGRTGETCLVAEVLDGQPNVLIAEDLNGDWAPLAYGAAGIRPLVVIDPEDAEQVGRLHKELFFKTGVGWSEFDRTQAALREFAAPTPPKPPKPAEPQGLGAVVEDASGQRFTRTCSCANSYSSDWRADRQAAGTDNHHWRDIDAVRVLSDGVTTGLGGE